MKYSKIVLFMSFLRKRKMLQVFLVSKYLGRGTDKKVLLLQTPSPNIHIYLTDCFSYVYAVLTLCAKVMHRAQCDDSVCNECGSYSLS